MSAKLKAEIRACPFLVRRVWMKTPAIRILTACQAADRARELRQLEMDGPSARHRGTPASKGPASRALCGRRPLEGRPRDSMVRLRASHRPAKAQEVLRR